MLTAVVLYAGAAFCFLLAYAQPDRAAVLPPLLYAALLLLLLFPGPLLYRDTRWFFGQTLWRVATPLRGVTWSVPLLLVVAKSQRARGFSSFAASLVLSGLADAARNPHHHHHPTPPTTTTRCCRSDFLLADILTSLAKAVSDTERAVCHLAIGPIMQPHLKVSTGSVAAAVVCAGEGSTGRRRRHAARLHGHAAGIYGRCPLCCIASYRGEATQKT